MNLSTKAERPEHQAPSVHEARATSGTEPDKDNLRDRDHRDT